MFHRSSTKGKFWQKIIHPLETTTPLSLSDFEVIAFIASGYGKLFLKINEEEAVNFLYQNLSFFIPRGSIIQIQNLQEESLELSLFSMPLSENIAFKETRTLCDNWEIRENPILSHLFKPLDHDRSDYMSPDGSYCRLLVKGADGDLAHFTQNPGQVSIAVKHRIIDEIWQIQSGQGEMWIKDENNEESVFPLEPGVVFSIIENAAFQFRNTGDVPLTFIAITMPRWPGNHVIDYVEGHWPVSSSHIAQANAISDNSSASLQQPATLFSSTMINTQRNSLDSLSLT